MDPITTKDSRSLKWIAEGRTRKAELEALPPDLIADFLTKAIEWHVDPNERDEAIRRQTQEKAVIWVPETKSGHSGIWDSAALLSRIQASNTRAPGNGTRQHGGMLKDETIRDFAANWWSPTSAPGMAW